MGFAKYQEDIVSRFNNDRNTQPSVMPAKGPAQTSIPQEQKKERPTMSRLKEFTTQNARPLPVILLADVSGSMSSDGKIQALNHAVKEMIEAFKDEADLRAEVNVAVITFGEEARLHMPLTPARTATWTDLGAKGNTPMGAAFELARAMVEDKQVIPGRAYRPTIVLISDGQPNDDWKPPLEALLGSDRGGKAFRMAMAIGGDADQEVLKAFLANSEEPVRTGNDARQIREFFQFVTMSVSTRSRSANPNATPTGGWDL